MGTFVVSHRDDDIGEKQTKSNFRQLHRRRNIKTAHANTHIAPHTVSIHNSLPVFKKSTWSIAQYVIFSTFSTQLTQQLPLIYSHQQTESGKVVIVLAGRYAGKKAVVVKTFDEGSDDKQFAHVLVAGIARGPRKVVRGMSKKKVEKRSRTMKPFVKYVNVRHVFPTRYVVDMDLKKAVDEADLVDDERKVDVKKGLKKVFEDRYLNQKAVTSEKKAAGSSYFFQKLSF
jgi:large subunit ribosomal protein L27e